jgi:hypothetical protein
MGGGHPGAHNDECHAPYHLGQVLIRRRDDELDTELVGSLTGTGIWSVLNDDDGAGTTNEQGRYCPSGPGEPDDGDATGDLDPTFALAERDIAERGAHHPAGWTDKKSA